MQALANATLLLTIFAVCLSAGGHDKKKMPVVSACVRPNNGEPPRQTLFGAQLLASQIFATAGVRLIWHARPTEQPILIDISLGARKNFRPGALAYAHPFGDPRITVFWDRVDSSPYSSMNVALLAHVFAHEIGHILEGTDSHSMQGIMKANWTVQEVEQMARGPLSFDPMDITLIHQGLVARSAATRQSIDETSNRD